MLSAAMLSHRKEEKEGEEGQKGNGGEGKGCTKGTERPPTIFYVFTKVIAQ